MTYLDKFISTQLSALLRSILERHNIMQFGFNTQSYFCGRATTKRRAYANEGGKGGHETTFSHFITAVVFRKFVCFILEGNIIFDHVHNDRISCSRRLRMPSLASSIPLARSEDGFYIYKLSYMANLTYRIQEEMSNNENESALIRSFSFL